MSIFFTATTDIWYITQPDNHCGKLKTGTTITSGQDSIEYFETEQEWLDAGGIKKGLVIDEEEN